MGTQLSETGELSSERKARAGIGALKKVSECATVPTSECDKSSTFSETTGGGGASVPPGCLQDLPLSSAIELPNDGRLDFGRELQRIGTDQICEQVDKSPPKEEE